MTLPTSLMWAVRDLLGARRRLRTVPLDGRCELGVVASHDIMAANVITSEDRLDPNIRYLTLDLDTPHVVVASSTKGHHHLLFTTPISRDAELEILAVLAKYGLIQEGYRKANQVRGWSAVRLPWIVKPPGAASSS